MAKAQKNRASKSEYVSPGQLVLVGFESPFTTHLNPNNRWVILAKQMPWDSISQVYRKQLHNNMYGAKGINPRVAIGAIIIKHICDLSDRETILQIQENIYMQHFIGFSSYSEEAIFDPSLFVELRKRLGADSINEINESIMGLVKEVENKMAAQANKKDDSNGDPVIDAVIPIIADKAAQEAPANPAEPLVKTVILNNGSLIVDATACPQDIAYPTDLNLLNDAREQSQRLIDFLFSIAKLQGTTTIKPRTYRKIARKEYLKVAQKKHKTRVEIRHALRKQLSYVNRNIKHIIKLLKNFKKINIKIPVIDTYNQIGKVILAIFYASQNF